MAYPNSSFMFMTQEHHEHDLLPSTSLNIPLYPPQYFNAPQDLLKRSMSFSGFDRCEDLNGDDEFSDDGQLGEKKKRLNLEQVKALEKSFELGNRLEPERKLQLAKTVGLQPRQVAIWFQNRRARWKTKQLERDYEILKKQFDALQLHNDSLVSQNKKLHAELMVLKRDSNENERCWRNGSDHGSDMNLEMRRTQVLNGSIPCQQSRSSRNLFPSSSIRSTNMSPIIQASSRSNLHCLKIDQTVQNESFCNIIGSIEDEQPAVWPWPEQNQFH